MQQQEALDLLVLHPHISDLWFEHTYESKGGQRSVHRKGLTKPNTFDAGYLK